MYSRPHAQESQQFLHISPWIKFPWSTVLMLLGSDACSQYSNHELIIRYVKIKKCTDWTIVYSRCIMQKMTRDSLLLQVMLTYMSIHAFLYDTVYCYEPCIVKMTPSLPYTSTLTLQWLRLQRSKTSTNITIHSQKCACYYIYISKRNNLRPLLSTPHPAVTHENARSWLPY